jgi:hypothetical protein
VSGGHCPDTLAVGVIKPRGGKTQATFELNLTMNSLSQCIWRLHSSIQQIECDLSSKLDSLADIYTPICMAAYMAVRTCKVICRRSNSLSMN